MSDEAKDRKVRARFPGSWEHTKHYGAMRRCLTPASSCPVAYTVLQECPSCGCKTHTIAEARLIREGA